MLNELSIENVAVIEKTDVHFGPGLNVLTGETGAGKSILIDSINAILGNRTSRDLVRSGAQKASVWATFSDLSDEVRALLSDAGYEPEDELLLSREIGQDGKSSCRINGKPATVGILRQLGEALITIHGQHDNQSLLNPANHLSILDEYAQNDSLLGQYRDLYHTLRDTQKQMSGLAMDEGEKQRKMDLLRYQTQEIEAAELQQGEEEELEEQRSKIHHSQQILDSLGAAYDALQGGDDYEGSVGLLGQAHEQLGQINEFSSEFSAFYEKLGELYYAGQDLAAELKSSLDDFDFEPAMLNEIEERLDLLYQLKRKYGPSVADIEAYYENALQELETIEFADQKLEELQQRCALLQEKATACAAQLTAARKKAFDAFSAAIMASLRFLNMPNIKFSLITEQTKLGPMGADAMEFFISTNPGEEPKPLAKIASGGELSRIMLAIKSVLAEKDHIPTVIYDEIDAGVSGLAAGRVGQKLQETAKSGHQVICITHTAQIAAYAQQHLLIEKSVTGERTYTKVRQLAKEERVAELARIVSGDKVTELSLANARELLELSDA